MKLRVLLLALLAAWAVTSPVFARDVVVAVYNVLNYLPTDRFIDGRRVEDAMKPESEIRAVVGIIASHQPDILALVEMGDQEKLRDLQSRLKAAGVDFPHSEWVRGADSYRHIALLSKFPITARNSRDDVPFELDGVPTRIGRGILDVTVKPTPNDSLRIVGIHLKSRRKTDEFDEAAMRAKEAWYVREHIDSILAANPDEKLMLVGDFNDTKNEYPVRHLIGSPQAPNFMRDLYLKDRGGLLWTHFWRSADEYSRIDFMLVSRALWPLVDMNRSGIDSSPNWFDGSDHRLIFTTLRFN